MVGFAPLHIMPYPDAACLFHDLVRLDAGGLGDLVRRIGNVVALPLGREAPAMGGAADRIPFHLIAVAHDIGCAVARDVDAHVRAISVEQNDASALAAIKSHVLPEEADGLRLLRHLIGGRHHEPATGKGQFTQAIFGCLCHDPRPSS